jgi:hypothetical protein
MMETFLYTLSEANAEDGFAVEDDLLLAVVVAMVEEVNVGGEV